VTNNRGATRGVIAVRMRWIVLGLLAVGLILALTACMGQWFTQEQKPYLVIGTPVVTGSHGEVIISVVNMSSEGAASIAIDDEGITYTNITASSVNVEGLNGFTVLAEDFTTSAGKGSLAAANANAGITGGPILKITFETTGNPTFTVTKTKVSIGSHLNTFITNWQLSTGKAYYAKDAAQQEGGAK